MSDHQLDGALIANGYEPIACVGKSPVALEWVSRPNTIEAIAAERTAHPDATNTGFRTGALVPADIDLTNPDHATRIEVLAVEVLGITSLKRVGKKGCILCYRNATPIRKITVSSNEGKIEILGTGQQFVGFGEHPDTGIPYQWIINDGVGLLDPLNVPYEALPLVTPDQLRAFARRAAEVLQELGYTGVKVTGDMGEKKEAPSARKGEPVKADHLREILGYIDPGGARDDWRNIVAAIRNTFIPGDDEETERRAIAREWSKGRLDRLGRYKDKDPEGYEAQEDVDQVFDTMPPRADGVGYGTIFDAAKKGGYEGAPARANSGRVFADAIAKLSITETKSNPANLFSTRAEDKLLMPPTMIVDKLFPDNVDIMLVGASGTFKSFITVAIAAAIATRKAVFGDKKFEIKRQAPIFYCAGEGGHNLRKQRLTAWEIAQGLPPYTVDRFHIASATPLLEGENVDEFIENAKTYLKTGEQSGLFIIDTMNRALNGADEDSSGTASRYLNMLTKIRNALGGSTLTLHHLGKDTSRGARGSSAFYAGFDTVLEIDDVTKDENTGESFIRLHIDKQKDGEDSLRFNLRARKVETPDGVSIAVEIASEDDTKRAAGIRIGLRRQEVGAALKARGACPGGVNEWDIEKRIGGIDTRALATQIAETRTQGTGQTSSEKEIASLVTILNRGARDNGPFVPYVVLEKAKRRQWAIAPGPLGEAWFDV